MNEFFSQRQLDIINSPTPKEGLDEKTEDGKKVKFVTGPYVKKVLNELFQFDWQEHIIRTDFFPDKMCVVVHMRLTALTDNGRPVLKEQFGGAYVDKNIPYAYKAAATDALKKCAAEIGLFSDVYNEEKTVEPQTDDPLATIERLKQECIELEIAFTKTDTKFFERTVLTRNKGNYEKCIEKLKIYIAKTQKQ